MKSFDIKEIRIRPSIKDMMFKYTDKPLSSCAELIAQVKQNKKKYRAQYEIIQNQFEISKAEQEETARLKKLADTEPLAVDPYTRPQHVDTIYYEDLSLPIVYCDPNDPKLNNTFSSQGLGLASSLSEPDPDLDPEPEPEAV